MKSYKEKTIAGDVTEQRSGFIEWQSEGRHGLVVMRHLGAQRWRAHHLHVKGRIRLSMRAHVHLALVLLLRRLLRPRLEQAVLGVTAARGQRHEDRDEGHNAATEHKCQREDGQPLRRNVGHALKESVGTTSTTPSAPASNARGAHATAHAALDAR